MEDQPADAGMQRRDVRALPKRRRPRRSVAQSLNGWNWRLTVFPLIFAPLMIGKLVWSSSGVRDWVLLSLALVPWAFFAL